MRLLSALEKHKNFWQAHDLSALPEYPQRELGVLANSRIVKSDVVADSGQKTVTLEIEKAEKYILAISPITTPEWTERVVRKADKGVKISLVISREVIDMQFRDEFKKIFRSYKSERSNKSEPQPAAPIRLERQKYSLLLCDEESLDMKNILFCRGEEAVAWGRKLFDSYAQKSEEFLLSK